MCVQVATSKFLYLIEGTTFELSYGDERVEMVWMGARVETEFTIQKPCSSGEKPASDDPDQREIHRGEIGVTILPSAATQRAKNVRVVAITAGIPESGYTIPFEVRLSAEIRPGPPRNFTLHERNQYEFTVTWEPPKVHLESRSDVCMLRSDILTAAGIDPLLIPCSVTDTNAHDPWCAGARRRRQGRWQQRG